MRSRDAEFEAMNQKAEVGDSVREAGAGAPALGVPAAGGNLAGHALYLDIDGTLLDIAETPDATQVPDFLVPLLVQLGRKVDGAIAFVSGRPIAAIDRLFRPLKLAAVGVHGGEIRMPDGQLIADQRLSPQLQAVEPLLQQAMQKIPGAALENKQCALALHYRRAPERGREVLNAAELVAGSLGGEFALSLGWRVRGRDSSAPPDQRCGPAPADGAAAFSWPRTHLRRRRYQR